jgi:hypothetical protein
MVVQAIGVEPSPRHLHAAAIPLIISLAVMMKMLRNEGLQHSLQIQYRFPFPDTAIRQGCF